MKKPISFFRDLLDEYGDFLIIQARPKYSTMKGIERIDEFVIKMNKKTKEYGDALLGEKKELIKKFKKLEAQR